MANQANHSKNSSELAGITGRGMAFSSFFNDISWSSKRDETD
jgi:hypothetical protein